MGDGGAERGERGGGGEVQGWCEEACGVVLGVGEEFGGGGAVSWG